MNLLDLRTLVLSHLATGLICLFMIGLLWRQDRTRYAGLALWFSDFSLQFVGALLVVLRGVLPDGLSMVASNTLIVVGVWLGFLGCERFLGLRNRQWHNYVLLALFFIVHCIFTFRYPSLFARNLNITVAFAFLFSQCAWLLLCRAPQEMRRLSRMTGIIFAGFAVVEFLRLLRLLFYPPVATDYFHSDLLEVLVFLAHQLLMIALTFSLVLLVNGRLLTEVLAHEARNRQSQKLESLGRMAGAVAHHFNNQLQSVILSLEMTRVKGCSNAELQEAVAMAMESARKAAEVSTSMLDYLGQPKGMREQISLSDLCAQRLAALRPMAPQGVNFTAHFPSPGPVVLANAQQVQQALANLVTNAWEALAGKPGSINLAIHTLSPESIASTYRFPPNWQPSAPAYACLEVADSAGGIPKEDIEKLFDPFFTSKFLGRGLGLPFVLGMVRAHQGGITVETKPDQGSVFRIFLPLSDTPPPSKLAPLK